ncbi:hypothetical protein [Risungbinella massiliensis]|uniref:hypothetical protein n=1 Tax=Risungbinella massiliensis TaxID=1329796 RepID=UPI0005CC762B|nr:hypothetical protein [Risungbinella massiliensis]
MNQYGILDLEAPIIPGQSLGGFTLKTHIKEYYDTIDTFPHFKSGRTRKGHTGLDNYYSMPLPNLIKYNFKDTLILTFNVLNGKLESIFAYENYQGLLFGKIGIGMKIDDAMRLDERIYYDEEEDGFGIQGVDGIAISPMLDRRKKLIIEGIGVYIKEKDERGSENSFNYVMGNW